MNTAPYKIYQKLYNDLVQEHSDDLANTPYVISEELVDNALQYFREASFPLHYPAKSYSVAIIYATKLNELYGIPVKDVLNDEDLFMGQDEFFKPYRDDPETYDLIMERLEKEIPDWINSGWAPWTVEYCLLECTEEGLQTINGGR